MERLRNRRQLPCLAYGKIVVYQLWDLCYMFGISATEAAHNPSLSRNHRKAEGWSQLNKHSKVILVCIECGKNGGFRVGLFLKALIIKGLRHLRSFETFMCEGLSNLK